MAGYLGNIPSAVPLTSADIADGIITTAKIADGNITSTKILDGTIVNADINASAGIVTSKLSGALGITEADSWRLTADITTTNAVISANLERDDTSGFGYIGTGMTQSSGIFTFPSTGIYQIICYCGWLITGENETYVRIETTTNNSTYTIRTYTYASSSGTLHAKSGSSSCLFDVTSTADCKVRFQTGSMNASCTLIGDTTANQTAFFFIRLGDT